MLKLSVEILDINDHSPRFPSSRVELEVSEATVPGVLFHINPAEDADGPEYGVAGYQLVSSSRHFDVRLPDPDAPFESPLLVLLEPLDREVQDLHQLKIVAEDGGSPARTGSVLVDVVVTDVNDNGPQFTKNSYKVNSCLHHIYMFTVKHNTHRRRDSTVELNRVGVGGVYMNSQL